MRTTRTLMLSLLAVFAFGAFAAGAAQAAGGPYWIVKCHKVAVAGTGRYKNATCTEPGPPNEYDTRLLAGETRTIKSTNVGVFKLKTASATIGCKKEKNTGKLFGGNPGTDETTITFEECSVEPKTVAECAATSAGEPAGNIKLTVKTVLVYPKGHPESTKEADDAFYPGTTGSNTFVEFEIKGTNCATLQGKKVKVTAKGTESPEPFAKTPCGVLAEVGKIEAGVFARTESGKEYIEGGLNFPEPAITEAELWLPATSKFETINCKLEAGGLGAAEEIGVAKVETEPAEEFGWEL